MTAQEFDAELQKVGPEACAFDVPFSAQEVFGSKAWIKVRGTINGAPFRSSIAPRGDGTHYMVVNQAVREAAGLSGGEMIHVVMEVDTEERTVEVPEDFQQVLDNHPEAKAFFEKLSYTHRKEYIAWIESAKKVETRLNRIEKAITKLTDGKKWP